MSDPTYVLISLVSGEEGILCRHCGRISWNANDVTQKYCGKCHRFHVDPIAAFNYQNNWLANMGYATWRMVLARELPIYYPAHAETLEDQPAEVLHAWLAAAAAIRRRVVNWKLSAEERDDDVG